MNRRLITPPEPAPPTVHEIIDALESARQLLGSCGQLAKGHAFIWLGDRLCFCTVGAITATSRTTAIRDEAMRAVRNALGPRWRSIEAYNDAASTTLEDAKTLLWQAKSYVGVLAA